jgi:hypothetical protein
VLYDPGHGRLGEDHDVARRCQFRESGKNQAVVQCPVACPQGVESTLGFPGVDEGLFVLRSAMGASMRSTGIETKSWAAVAASPMEEQLTSSAWAPDSSAYRA